MDILSQKKKVFGNIAAAKTLTESMPQLKTNSSFPSINNNGDSITFLCDLLKALVGYESLQTIITDTIVYSLKDIEQEVKNALKLELKSIVSCGINPSLPDFVKNEGIKYTVNKVDFTGLMFVDPRSDNGKLLYNDITPNLLESSDYNTFLYQTIQNNGTSESWPQYAGTTEILTFKFQSYDVSGIDPNNTITAKASTNFTGTLTDLNNKYIDSITLFNTEKLLTNIIDIVFGSVSSAVNKSLNQLENEAKINIVVDKIVNSDNKDVITDEYFSLSDVEKSAAEIEAKARKKGEKLIDTSGKIGTSISVKLIREMNDKVGSAVNDVVKYSAVANSLNSMGSYVSNFSKNLTDQKAIQLNFIQELVSNLTKGIVNSILSPKVVSIFILNYKIVYGPDATYTDAIDFIKKNKNLISAITKKISGIIVKALLNAVLKRITVLVAETVIKQTIDKNQSNLTQLLSLVGVPQEALRQIKGLL